MSDDAKQTAKASVLDRAELAVLGGILNNPDRFVMAKTGLGVPPAARFGRQRHRAIWTAMDDLHSKGLSITLDNLLDRLEKSGARTDAEAIELLPGLMDHGAVDAASLDVAVRDLVQPLPAKLSAEIIQIDEPGAFSDTAQGAFIAVNHADEIRYCAGLGWIAWDGKRWATSRESPSPMAIMVAQRAAKRRLIEAVDSGRGDLVDEATRLLDRSHITAALAMAQSHMAVDVAKLDTDPYLLNCTNGTLNLRTGKIRPHCREDMLTKLSPTSHDPTATHWALDRLLASFDGSGPGAVQFLQRAIGCSLTGDASPETMFIMSGLGGGGKTTLAESVGSMLGDDYAVKLKVEALLASKHGKTGGGASPDLVRLRGARFAYCAEADAAARMDAGTVKVLSGGERLTARGLYCDEITFPQTWKLWLATNYDPKCDSDDSGLWRRLVKVPIPSVPPEQRDPQVKSSLVGDPAAWSAVLTWAIQGCMAWLADGGGRKALHIPLAVEQATMGYRTSCDSISTWFASAVEDGLLARRENAHAHKKLVRELYDIWCNENHITAAQGDRFAKWMVSNGFEPSKLRIGGSRVPTFRNLATEVDHA